MKSHCTIKNNAIIFVYYITDVVHYIIGLYMLDLDINDVPVSLISIKKTLACSALLVVW